MSKINTLASISSLSFTGLNQEFYGVKKMNLFEVLDTLKEEQIKDVAGILGVDNGAAKSKDFLKQKIKDNLIDFYKGKSEQKYYQPFQIVELWRDYIEKVIREKKVKATNEARKKAIIGDLNHLLSKDKLNDHEQIELIVREILILFWEESSEEEKMRFIETVKKDLESHQIKLTDDELRKLLKGSFLMSFGSITPLIIPIVSRIILQRLTQGFMAWFALTILGRGAAQVALLGALAGPMGWVVCGGLLGIGVISSGVKYSSERKKLRFVQIVFSIYGYYYQNRLNER